MKSDPETSRFPNQSELVNMDLLAALPDELLFDLFRSLDVVSFLSLSRANRHLHDVSQDCRLLQNAERRTRSVLHYALDLRSSFLITGPGGVGKSYTLSKLHQAATERNLRIAMTAPTGIAATNLTCGRTIHSYSRLGLAKISLADIQMCFQTRTGQWYKWQDIWLNTDILVIDEISMLGASLFEKVELCARLARGGGAPFGGMQVILCGDFFQLPPVEDRFVFTSPIWSFLALPIVPLTTPVRQRGDLQWFNLLNRIRIGSVVSDDITLLSSRVSRLDMVDILSGEYGCMLVSTNKEASTYNTIAFDCNPHDIVHQAHAQDSIFENILEGDYFRRVPRPDLVPASYQDRIERRLIKIPSLVELKHGAVYAITFNIDTDAGLVNGKMCRFDATEGERGRMVSLTGEVLPDYILNPIDREVYIAGKLFFLRRQIPFRLGHALTIHSSQGMTLSEAVVDCGCNIFTSAQTYVALSRVERLEGLTLTDLDPTKIKANSEAVTFYEALGLM